MIRQTPTGMEQFCRTCESKGEPQADCWLPLTDEFFPRKYKGSTRSTHLESQCKACKSEAKARQRQAVAA